MYQSPSCHRTSTDPDKSPGTAGRAGSSPSSPPPPPGPLPAARCPHPPGGRPVPTPPQLQGQPEATTLPRPARGPDRRPDRGPAPPGTVRVFKRRRRVGSGDRSRSRPSHGAADDAASHGGRVTEAPPASATAVPAAALPAAGRVAPLPTASQIRWLRLYALCSRWPLATPGSQGMLPRHKDTHQAARVRIPRLRALRGFRSERKNGTGGPSRSARERVRWVHGPVSRPHGCRRLRLPPACRSAPSVTSAHTAGTAELWFKASHRK